MVFIRIEFAFVELRIEKPVNWKALASGVVGKEGAGAHAPPVTQNPGPGFRSR